MAERKDYLKELKQTGVIITTLSFSIELDHVSLAVEHLQRKLGRKPTMTEVVRAIQKQIKYAASAWLVQPSFDDEDLL